METSIKNLFKMRGLAGIFTLLFALLILNGFSQEAGNDSKFTITVTEWLRVGSFELKIPVYDTVKNVNNQTFNVKDLLSFSQINPKDLRPEENAPFAWTGLIANWEKVVAAKDGFSMAGSGLDSASYQFCFFAAYVEVDRWLAAELTVSCPQLFEVYFDKNVVMIKTAIDKNDAEKVGNSSQEVKIEKGKHLVVIKTLKPKGNPKEWKIKAEFSFQKKYSESCIQTSLVPRQIMNIHQLLEGTRVQSAEISPDGESIIIQYAKVTPPDGKSENWAEVVDLETGRMVQTFKNSKIFDLEWVPAGRKLSYKTNDESKGTSVWILDLENMQEKLLLENVKELGGITWAKGGSFFIYSIYEKPEENKTGLKKLEGMPDRWPWYRNRGFLYKFDVASGVSVRLTYGHLSTNLHDISSAGDRILFSIDEPDFSQRPFSKQYLVEMNLETWEIDTIWVKNFSGSCSYSPDGKKLLVTGSPAMFGTIGINLSDDKIPNDYDTQAYIYDLKTGVADPITHDFNPAINNAVWSSTDNNTIYFTADDRTYVKLFSYNLKTRKFSELKSGFDVVSQFSMADDAALAVCLGSSISTPPHLNKLNLKTGEVATIDDPARDEFRDVFFGKTETWTFKNKEGVEIDGKIYYPPNFDKSKKYPLIVYYYGGTSPTEQSFGGRYPRNLFAAQGYVVYNLQPSGATGYGQDFSAAHVNNWGITVADEIIQGTKLFYRDHSFIDSTKIGCIGASYGGFVTMLLQTRTDIFAAAISHAGISSISSYWGEGYWGYLYNAVAAANSYPWNNPTLYIEQSALFQADKIITPLLLLHGKSDTNVPPGESYQLYTALKLLGKTVELVEVEGQDHHILDYKKRIQWQNTIFSWFDKWLKNQPEWWNDLYPDRNL